MSIERRDAVLHELRVSGASAPGTALSGVAIVYGALSEDLGGYRETFLPGSAELADDLLILFSHDARTVLGRSTANTARAGGA